jgi:hypothetical protein
VVGEPRIPDRVKIDKGTFRPDRQNKQQPTVYGKLLITRAGAREEPGKIQRSAA